MSSKSTTKRADPEPTSTADQCRPKGVYLQSRPGKSRPFLAHWREGGVKKARSFETDEARGEFVKSLREKLESFGKLAEITPRNIAAKWRAFEEITGGADPVEVAKFYARHKSDLGGFMLLSEAIRRFHLLRSGQAFSADTQSHRKKHLDRMLANIGDVPMKDCTTDALRTWLASLRNDDGAPVAQWTYLHHLRTAKLFFSIAVRERWASDNPAARIVAPRIQRADVSVLSLQDAQKLFSVNRDHRCIARLALEAFGGLRYTSAARISRAEIIDADKGIVMPAEKHKSGRRHYVDGYPENLWCWIEHAKPECWAVGQRLYLALKGEMFRAAGIAHPHNVLRHSFCSYHVALHKDAARTAVLLTHRSPAMLYQHYRGRATEADAKEYFSITP